MEVEPPSKQPSHTNPKPRANGQATYDSDLQPRPAAAIEHEVIDERFLSARELKKRRKDEKKEKRDERQARKDERVLEAVEGVGGANVVGMKGRIAEEEEMRRKRKADGVKEGERKKKRKDKA